MIDELTQQDDSLLATGGGAVLRPENRAALQQHCQVIYLRSTPEELFRRLRDVNIVTWVGYIGGVTKGVVAEPLAAGLAGATVATFFTFLPSFWFIIRPNILGNQK